MAVTVTDAGVGALFDFQSISKLHIYNWKILAISSRRLHQSDLTFGIVKKKNLPGQSSKAQDYIKFKHFTSSVDSIEMNLRQPKSNKLHYQMVYFWKNLHWEFC